jgi:RNA polymerase sigma-32 factor
MQVTSTTANNAGRARKAAQPNPVKPARSVTRSPPLTLTEIDLIRAYQAGDKRAASALLEMHAGLIHETARCYFRGSHRDDVLQEARLGFLDGVTRFDETAGVKLTTYAVYWIRYSVECYLGDHGSPIGVPLSAFRARGKELTQDLAYNATRCLRLDAPLGDADSQTLGELLGDEDGETLGERLLDRGETLETVAAVASQHAHYRRMMAPLLETLSPLEREILLCRVMAETGSEETLAAVGAKIGVSAERVERMQRAVLKKLGQRLATAGLKAMADVDEADLEMLAWVQCPPRVRKKSGG